MFAATAGEYTSASPSTASGVLASVPPMPARAFAPRLPRRLPAVIGAIAAALIALTGCGKTASEQPGSGAGVETVVIHTGAAGTAATATRNTTRLGGADAVDDAAAVSRAAYPGLTAATRPQAVVLV